MSGGGAQNEAQCDRVYAHTLDGLKLLYVSVNCAVLKLNHGLDTIVPDTYTGCERPLRKIYLDELYDWMLMLFTRANLLSKQEQLANSHAMMEALAYYEMIFKMLAVRV